MVGITNRSSEDTAIFSSKSTSSVHEPQLVPVVALALFLLHDLPQECLISVRANLRIPTMIASSNVPVENFTPPQTYEVPYKQPISIERLSSS